MNNPPLMLDTHVWLWFTEGSGEIKADLRKRVANQLKDGAVLIPTICVWEIGMLCQKKRLNLSKPIEDWVKHVLSQPGVSFVPLSQEIALEATNLPGEFHRDPADCIIVATARVEGASLLTRDRRIIAYGKSGHVNVISA
jgi:PIN domain nuclease of toxin-antitoxin system